MQGLTQDVQTFLKKRNKVRELILPDFKIYYKVTTIRQCGAGVRTDVRTHEMELKIQKTAQCLWSAEFPQGCQGTSMRERVVFHQIVQENEVGPHTSHHIKKNEVKMNQRVKCKTKTVKLLEENTGVNLVI